MLWRICVVICISSTSFSWGNTMLLFVVWLARFSMCNIWVEGWYFGNVTLCLVLYEIHFLCLVLCIISKEAVEMEMSLLSYESILFLNLVFGSELVLMRRNNMWLACVQILKIDEVGELFEEARGTLNKNVVYAIKELHIYNAL